MLILSLLKALAAFRACSVNLHHVENEQLGKDLHEELQLGGIFAGSKFQLSSNASTGEYENNM